MSELRDESRESVLHHIRREVKHLSGLLRATEPYASFTTTIERLRRSKTLADAARQVGWESLVVLRDTPVACVKVTEDNGRTAHASTAFGDVPTAVVAAVQVAETTATRDLSVGDIAILKIGQLGVMAVWVRIEGFVVPMRLRSERRGVRTNRVYKESAFVRALLKFATRIEKENSQ